MNAALPDGTTTYQKSAKKHAKTLRQKFANLTNLDADTQINNFVYIIVVKELNAFKIGWSTNIEQRKKAIQKTIAYPCELIKTITGSYHEMRLLEKSLHARFDFFNIILPRSVKGRTEWFSADCLDECISYLNFMEHK